MRLSITFQKSGKLHHKRGYGAADRIRTGDLYNANVARYQLC